MISDKKQELLNIREHVDSFQVVWWCRHSVAHLFNFLCFCFFFVFVLCIVIIAACVSNFKFLVVPFYLSNVCSFYCILFIHSELRN